jgi:hypothetical protein
MMPTPRAGPGLRRAALESALAARSTAAPASPWPTAPGTPRLRLPPRLGVGAWGSVAYGGHRRWSAALLKAALDQGRLASKEPQILIDKDRVPA